MTDLEKRTVYKAAVEEYLRQKFSIDRLEERFAEAGFTPMSADKLQRLKREMAADKLSDAAACCQGLGLTLQEAEALLREAWEPKA